MPSRNKSDEGRPSPLLEGQDEKVANDPARNLGWHLGRDRRERWARDIYIENLKNIRTANLAGRDAGQIRDEFNISGPVTDERIAKAEEDNVRIRALLKNRPKESRGKLKSKTTEAEQSAEESSRRRKPSGPDEIFDAATAPLAKKLREKMSPRAKDVVDKSNTAFVNMLENSQDLYGTPPLGSYGAKRQQHQKRDAPPIKHDPDVFDAATAPLAKAVNENIPKVTAKLKGKYAHLVAKVNQVRSSRASRKSAQKKPKLKDAPRGGRGPSIKIVNKR